jgi:hypothetical protein
MSSTRNPAFELNDDGSAKDPAAFRAALLADEQRVKKLQVRVLCFSSTALSPRRAFPGFCERRK